MFFTLEVTKTFGTDDVLRPFAGNEIVKEFKTHWLTAVINVSANAVFLCFAFAMMVVVMAAAVLMVMMAFRTLVIIMVVMMFVFFIIFVIMVMMLMAMAFLAILMMVVAFFVMVMVVMVFMLILIILFVLMFIMLTLQLVDPSSGRGNRSEVKKTCVDEFVKVNIAIVALYNLCLWLESTHYLLDTFQF